MSNPPDSHVPKSKKNSGLPIVFGLFGLAFLLGVVFFFVLANSTNKMTKSFAKMQEMGKTLTIQGCAQKNMEWYESCSAQTQICEQSVSKMMRVCLVNGDKNSQCAQYGDTIYGYNFGATECTPYFSERKLKKACADTYQAIADFCKAVRKIP